MNKKDLIEFEKEIEKLYQEGKIIAPVHLSGDNEEKTIEIFQGVQKNDWVFSTWRNHYHSLLKGIDPEWLKQEIVKGHSMNIMNKEHKVFTSSIVSGHLPVALGVSMALKRKNSKDKVWAFCGDMSAETGVFHEVTKYATRHDLPINFVVEDNGLSVYTPTQEVWGGNGNLHLGSKRNLEGKTKLDSKIINYNYNRRWPHHGIGMWIDFPEEGKAEDNYKEEINKAMKLLAEDERVLFLGQTVGYAGSPIYGTLEGIVEEKRIELPVIEEVQMGMATGMALEGYVPISIYPRFDFMTLATNQLVNHLDKTNELSQGQFNPKVIIRTMVGGKKPIYPGPQHCQDHTEAYRLMLTNIDVIKIEKSKDVIPIYRDALKSKKPSLIVEMAELYK